MDSGAENRLVTELMGRRVGGWDILSRINSGKSAVVFQASRNGEDAALKVFDPELVARSGRELQLKRIARELSLRTKPHPNLVRVIDGGECPDTQYLFVAMERILAPNLADVLKQIPREAIRLIISQVASAARFLETLDPPVAHRDIKPDNIAISPDFQNATLLDLGVLLPIDLKDKEPASDEERRFFVGTLRYGPPEFLVRKEEYSIEGWRAVTFYQLGAVLHDLIMRERIFEAFADPYPRLVMAVEHEIPKITTTEVSEDLILLAKNCLSKDPKIRLEYVRWADFEPKAAGLSAAMGAKERVRRRIALSTSDSERAANERERLMLRTVQEVQGRLHTLVKSGWALSEMFCPIECHEYLDNDPGVGFVALLLPETKKLLLPRSLSVWFKVRIIDEKAVIAEINYVAALATTPPTLAEAKGRPSRALFAGVFQDGIVQGQILDLLYQLLDLAQSFSETGLTADNHWLDLAPAVIP